MLLIGVRNTQLATLAQELYYKNNIFRIFVEPLRGGQYHKELLCLRHPSCVHASSIRHIEVQVPEFYIRVEHNIRQRLEHMFAESKELQWLLQPTTDLEKLVDPDLDVPTIPPARKASDTTHTQWQHRFTNLKTMVLEVTAALDNRKSDTPGCDLAPLEKHLQDATIFLSAKRVRVRTHVVLCKNRPVWSEKNRVWANRCCCEDKLARLLEDMMAKNARED
jgi:hypothetical protein